MATTITYTQQGDYFLPDLQLPEQPKAYNTIEWIRKMNAIRLTATEIVNREIIYT